MVLNTFLSHSFNLVKAALLIILNSFFKLEISSIATLKLEWMSVYFLLIKTNCDKNGFRLPLPLHTSGIKFSNIAKSFHTLNKSIQQSQAAVE